MPKDAGRGTKRNDKRVPSKNSNFKQVHPCERDHPKSCHSAMASGFVVASALPSQNAPNTSKRNQQLARKQSEMRSA
eukprot:4182245-Amphidinium_carterae.1